MISDTPGLTLTVSPGRISRQLSSTSVLRVIGVGIRFHEAAVHARTGSVIAPVSACVSDPAVPEAVGMAEPWAGGTIGSAEPCVGGIGVELPPLPEHAIAKPITEHAR